MKGIKPMWEDKSNVNGGRWLLSQNKQVRRECLEERWLDTMLFLIGDDHHGQQGHGGGGGGTVSRAVNGAVVSVRTKLDKIGVWVGSGSSGSSRGFGGDQVARDIGARFKRYLRLQEQIVFETHQVS